MDDALTGPVVPLRDVLPGREFTLNGRRGKRCHTDPMPTGCGPTRGHQMVDVQWVGTACGDQLEDAVMVRLVESHEEELARLRREGAELRNLLHAGAMLVRYGNAGELSDWAQAVYDRVHQDKAAKVVHVSGRDRDVLAWLLACESVATPDHNLCPTLVDAGLVERKTAMSGARLLSVYKVTDLGRRHARGGAQ